VQGAIHLTQALPDITDDLTIDGPGADRLSVVKTGSGQFRAFTVANGVTAAIDGLKIANASVPVDGGGIRNNGTLTLDSVWVTGNGSPGVDLGGGIHNNNTLTVINSAITGNTAATGGGIGSSHAILSVINSTVAGNTSTDGLGGGIAANFGNATIKHSTIAGNSCPSGWTMGGGLFAGMGGNYTLQNTIVAGNNGAGAPDISGSANSLGYNLIGDTKGGFGFDDTDLLNVDPELGPLQNNGGPTPTMALLPSSPAIDAGDPNPTDPPEWDQRGPGFPRIVNGRLDIGAFEVQATGAPSAPVVSRAFPETAVVLITAIWDDES
jgi:hypothetical protein